MPRILQILGLICVVAVVALSIGMHWYVKKKADAEAIKAGQVALRGSLARTILCILAAVFFLLSNVV